MRLSKLFTKTSKTSPAEETARNAQLLIKAGFIHKEMAGVYTFLPLGKKVLDKIAQIVREEMDIVGGQEMLLTTLQPKDLWEQTGRWNDQIMDVWFKTKLQNGTEVGLAATHEEPLSSLLKRFINSYKDLPFLIYQIQTKFRNELRAKSGLMRGREFLMKDMYSFARSQKEHDEIYQRVIKAYHKVYSRLGIDKKTYLTFASGGSFSKFSHEFQTLTEAGEDTIYIDEDKKIAINEEVFSDELIKELGLEKSKLKKAKAAEVGNIFSLATKFSKPFNLSFVDEDGAEKLVLMGCYGMGISRALAVIAELFSDEYGLSWPQSVAPAKVYIARLGDTSEVVKAADGLYETLKKQGVEVLYDDRALRPGEKFADADLMGIPYRVVVSDKTVKNKKFEIKKRTEKTSQMLDIGGILEVLVAENKSS